MDSSFMQPLGPRLFLVPFLAMGLGIVFLVALGCTLTYCLTGRVTEPRPPAVMPTADCQCDSPCHCAALKGCPCYRRCP